MFVEPRHGRPPDPLSSGVNETMEPREPNHPGIDGASRLLTSLVDRSAPPHRSVGGLINRWYAASGTSLLFDEWADPAAGDLVVAFDGASDVRDVEDAVVAFAQARAGAAHPVEAVAADLVALVRLAWPSGRGTWGEIVDPVGLVARALGAWAVEHSRREFVQRLHRPGDRTGERGLRPRPGCASCTISAVRWPSLPR